MCTKIQSCRACVEALGCYFNAYEDRTSGCAGTRTAEEKLVVFRGRLSADCNSQWFRPALNTASKVVVATANTVETNEYQPVVTKTTSEADGLTTADVVCIVLGTLFSNTSYQIYSVFF